MELMPKFRLLAAAALCPLIIPLMVQSVFWLFYGSNLQDNPDLAKSTEMAIWFSYFLTVFLSVPAYFIIRAKLPDTPLVYIIAGALVGFLDWLMFSLVSWYFVTLLFFVFTIGGLLLGSLFWLTVHFQPDGNYPVRRNNRRGRRRT